MDERTKITVPKLQQMKQEGRPITMLTAYDYPTALLVDRAGIDVILVGDSLGMVVLGYESTLPVTMDEMIHHCKAVRRGARYALLVGDMPFMSYQSETYEAVKNAGRFLKEAGMDAVKLEGGRDYAPVVEAIVRAGIPVMGHIGLTPQFIARLGGFKVQGRTAQAARALLEDARALEAAGCFALVLEAIPDRVAARITDAVRIPTIGIGAGPHCDGQVLVTHDLIGLFDRFVPRFVKQYTNIARQISEAVAQYRQEVLDGTFPGPEHRFTIKDEEWEAFEA
ncbi:MAG: 3-methyl-2-oxobutanoate hydroxymethyltransferase [Chloroflexi bacterium]|nr:MAG: 3-methyl-2-oxobutanoate hydroxymethyltransferase [Chloroflexota bacterium]